jgi:hypothetical protein
MVQDETLTQGQGLDMWEKGKAEAIFRELFDEVQGAVSRVYIPGTMAHIKERHRTVYEEILNTEAELGGLWLAMREGKDTLEKFRDALKAWETLHLKAIEIYRGGEGEAMQKTLF